MIPNEIYRFPCGCFKHLSHRIRHFSIMEYYRSVRPVPPPVETSLTLPCVKKELDTPINDKLVRSTRPYVGPQISTRQPVPLEASTVSWMSPTQPKDPRFLKVALLGLPNSGKSSFLNSILNSTISAVSPKVNTTREDIKGILTIDNCQIVLIDSPGIIASHKRRKFCKDLVRTAWKGFDEADLCLFLVDAVKRPKSDLYNILRVLSGKNPLEEHVEKYQTSSSPDSYETSLDDPFPDDFEDSIDSEEDDEPEDRNGKREVPIALVLNKIDLVSHKKWVKSRVKELKVHGNFCDVFYTSAKYSMGFTPLINFLKLSSKPGPWVYPSDMVTTMSKVKVVEQLVRTYIFCWFNKDVPYKIDQSIIGWTYAENGTLNIEMELYVKSVKVAKMICGIKGRILKQLQKNVAYKLSKMWNEVVFLFIHVKLR
ncbi:small GTP-binding domain protein [Theileria parva strain Muguga]|uniref:small GTP-binding domain protein n=1 Tax=Theileria parva strain Muguga TaxID=333668 RepID=UPI001C61D430|nr:small GTP-binding domain protein [Theileria parva strain Muguga]EAN32141.2 small GTP-binding domain protein [Theileria parva strain Muguga]